MSAKIGKLSPREDEDRTHSWIGVLRELKSAHELIVRDLPIDEVLQHVRADIAIPTVYHDFSGRSSPTSLRDLVLTHKLFEVHGLLIGLLGFAVYSRPLAVLQCRTEINLHRLYSPCPVHIDVSTTSWALGAFGKESVYCTRA